jgi:RNA polymerase sigma-54 factor
MEMKFKMQMGMRQQLVMTPRLQQALKLLQLPTLELEMALKDELQSNPLLEIEEEEEQDPSTREGSEEQAANTADTWDDGFEMQYEQQEEVSDDEFVEKVPIYRQDSGDNLLQQIRMLTNDPKLLEIGEYLIGSLDDRGFLTIDLSEVENVFEVDEQMAKKALKLIQSLEPSGIGARDLPECLLIQLHAKGMEDSLTAVLIRDHFKALVQRKYQAIARKLKTTVEAIQEAARRIGELDPKPGLELSTEDPRYVTPDLIVEEVEGEYIVALNDRYLPRLRISDAYKEGVADRDKRTKEFLQGKLSQAQWLIKTVEQRRSTMIKVMNAIVEEQREFFDRGPQALHPLTLQQVASKIGMHESTVSRVTSHKWVQTPRGTFSLKYFFSSSLSTAGGEEVSAKAAKDRIREIVSKEDEKRPFSDQKIADMLKDEGLVIARRTVAKYREQLGILPARMRKQY